MEEIRATVFFRMKTSARGMIFGACCCGSKKIGVEEATSLKIKIDFNFSWFFFIYIFKNIHGTFLLCVEYVRFKRRS